VYIINIFAAIEKYLKKTSCTILTNTLRMKELNTDIIFEENDPIG
jgi:hypothetical protein